MKKLLIYTVAILSTLCASFVTAEAQESSNSGVRRREAKTQETSAGSNVTGRMKSFLGTEDTSLSEGDVQWLRVIYREIDLNKDENAALYFPEDVVDGQENLIRIIIRLLANNEIPAYEYLDGKEIFTDQYRIDLKQNLERFNIYITEAKGSTEKNRKYEIQENDVPANQVLVYYVIERWAFDNRQNRMKTYVEAICPVLVEDEYGGEPQKFPLFWVKYNDLRPHLAQQEIFISDDNNLPTCTYDDFFTMNMYQGDIIKTRNLKNKSMAQLYQDPDDLKRAQDSIQARLDSFENKLWVPNREEIIAAREAREAAAAGDSTLVADSKSVKEKKSTRTTSRSAKKSTKVKEKKPKTSSSSSSSSATRSVRRKK